MIYYIGLIYAILVILLSIDNIFWEIYYFILKRTKKMKDDTLSIKDLESVTPKLLAIIIAAYNEENVLEAVIENIIDTQEYPASMYHIFIGVYPNDPKTKEIAEKIDKKYSHVHSITHVLEGPSSKADNINNVIENMYKYEAENNLRFKGIIIHDSEDIVHPYEFLLDNYLFETKSALQIPVFPLQEMPRLSNLFTNLVSGTYADEFAENHVRTLYARNAANAFVPSAGTGFGLRRDVLESFPDSNVFPVGSLTEDFKLSLQLKEKGFDVYYPLETVTRLDYQKNEKIEFIATRSMFPKTYKAAVKQKTRWIYGITMQSFKLKDILFSKNLNLQSKYSLYKDWKAKFANLLILPGYIVLTYFIFSLFLDIPIMYPMYSLSWYLVVFLTLLMAQKQFVRFFAVKKVYGIRSALMASLIPPFLPLRLVVGNFINFHATFNAWRMKIFKPKKKDNKNKKNKHKPKWSKTDHEFLEKNILKRFKRNTGDDLLKKELISIENLNKALNMANTKKMFIGETIVALDLVPEIEVIKSIAVINKREFLNKPIGRFAHRNKESYDLDLLMDIEAIPLFETDKQITLITTIDKDVDKIIKAFDKQVEIVYCTNEVLSACIEGEESTGDIERNLYIIEKLIFSDLINVKQGLIAIRYTEENQDIKETLNDMGFLYNIEYA